MLCTFGMYRIRKSVTVADMTHVKQDKSMYEYAHKHIISIYSYNMISPKKYVDVAHSCI